ncbi:WG repeat-containing protein [Chitinophaga silvatica]|uniref:WG repeat-containing protein n=1 Tax=Chitinophaga silvatica TaxID=2282649 RepID=A0A3E1YGU9_9BACT|nr:WG repeat-containing protein [Chitinophaga silvatica]RFS26430.1 WG repeat-containing protein [Chitinophaga silvatica]
MKKTKFLIPFIAAVFLTNTLNAQVAGSRVYAMPESNGAYKLVPYLKGKLWGFSDANGNIVIEPAYEQVDFFDYFSGVAKVILKGKQLLIDPSGKVKENKDSRVLFDDSPRMAELKSGKYGEDIQEASLSKNGKHGFYIDYDEGVLHKAPVYGKSRGYFDNYNSLIIELKSTGKYGGVNKDGDIIIPFEYDDWTNHFGDGVFFVMKIGEKLGMIDRKNNVIFPFKYQKIEKLNMEGTNFLVKDSVYGYLLDTARKPLYNKPLRDVEFARDMIKARDDKGLYGYLNTAGQVVIPFIYKEARAFGDSISNSNYAWVTNNKGVRFLVSKTGREYYSK